ncbi:molybdopterin-guanine dinucleotide biosynthesis protein B [Chloroflexota bacterium]
MPAIVSIVGNSNSGKTTLVEKLVRELKARGYRIATVKHTPQEATFDEPGKDSWRHLQAGSETTVVGSQDRIMLIKPVTSASILDEVIQLLGEDFDIILVEGFKQSDTPKIEVHRKETGPLIKDLKNLIAIATNEPLETETRQFSLDDTKGLAYFIEDGYIKPQEDRLSLYVNDEPVSLSVFPKDIITNILLGMANSLKGVGKVTSIKAFLKKRE